MKNDSVLAHVRELLDIREFASRHPEIYASHDPVEVLDDQHIVYVDVRPAAWPTQEPQRVVPTSELVRSGVIACLLEGGMAIVGYPKAVYRHLRDEATVRLWLGAREDVVHQAITACWHLSGVARRIDTIVA